MSDVHGSYPECLTQLGLTTLELSGTGGDAIELFKYLRGSIKVDKESLFTTNALAPPKTQQQNTFMPFIVPRANLDLRKNLFPYEGLSCGMAYHR